MIYLKPGLLRMSLTKGKSQYICCQACVKAALPRPDRRISDDRGIFFWKAGGLQLKLIGIWRNLSIVKQHFARSVIRGQLGHQSRTVQHFSKSSVNRLCDKTYKMIYYIILGISSLSRAADNVLHANLTLCFPHLWSTAKSYILWKETWLWCVILQLMGLWKYLADELLKVWVESQCDSGPSEQNVNPRIPSHFKIVDSSFYVVCTRLHPARLH